MIYQPVTVPRVSRRGLLGGAAAVSAALLTGCGPSADPASTSAGQPRRGGRLRAAFAGGGVNETLDPHLANLFNEASRAKAMFDKLADYGPDVSIQPRLAERWEPNSDLTRWRITLREATFHDGRPVRAVDVLYSYARITDPERAFRAKASLDLLDLPNSRAVGDRTLELALKRPFAEFPNALAAFGAYIVPEGADSFERPVGSGPFTFDSWQPGRSLLLKRYDGYWEGAAHLDELEYLISNEESARVNALLAGQVEYAHDITPTTARTHADGGRMAVVRMPNSTMQSLAMKVDRPPFDNRDLREAMFLLTDRQQLVDTVLAGSGQVGNDLFGKGYQYYADDIPQRIPDLDRARFLVDKAGARGLRIPLDTASVASGFVEAASVFADQAKQAGLVIEPALGNKDTYWKDILNSGVLASYRSGAMPIETHISQRLLTNSTTNATRWARPEFDARYAEAVSSADEATRRQAYGDMQRTLHAEGGFLIWGFADFLVATAPRVGGVSADAPANTLDWARFDKVWLG
ncbi:ABC transporter substrate-binding protein [Micromonospora sp. C95]|uniref:ABC transporter substrate-binding protein n=1 Tax=Micromonospora sp. C95 TaxID=2824882 RepID=UPI0026574C62|nr:ABC transporter substrate-binding protein [Micromonospora sp. C95]